jgi:O-acetyl-ADP-ribose deacetylase (regulator of RNase III)
MDQKTQFGNILSVTRGIIVHGCNARGVMGSGVALAIRKTYPQAFKVYREIFEDRGLELGSVIFVPITDELFVANAITQENYNNQKNGPACMVDYGAIKRCFLTIANYAKGEGLPVHYPMIGAGLGGGDWDIIQGIIDETLHGIERTLWKLPPLPTF